MVHDHISLWIIIRNDLQALSRMPWKWTTLLLNYPCANAFVKLEEEQSFLELWGGIQRNIGIGYEEEERESCYFLPIKCPIHRWKLNQNRLRRDQTPPNNNKPQPLLLPPQNVWNNHYSKIPKIKINPTRRDSNQYYYPLRVTKLNKEW